TRRVRMDSTSDLGQVVVAPHGDEARSFRSARAERPKYALVPNVATPAAARTTGRIGTEGLARLSPDDAGTFSCFVARVGAGSNLMEMKRPFSALLIRSRCST